MPVNVMFKERAFNKLKCYLPLNEVSNIDTFHCFTFFKSLFFRKCIVMRFKIVKRFLLVLSMFVSVVYERRDL